MICPMCESFSGTAVGNAKARRQIHRGTEHHHSRPIPSQFPFPRTGLGIRRNISKKKRPLRYRKAYLGTPLTATKPNTPGEAELRAMNKHAYISNQIPSKTNQPRTRQTVLVYNARIFVRHEPPSISNQIPDQRIKAGPRQSLSCARMARSVRS